MPKPNLNQAAEELKKVYKTVTVDEKAGVIQVAPGDTVKKGENFKALAILKTAGIKVRGVNLFHEARSSVLTIRLVMPKAEPKADPTDKQEGAAKKK